MDAALSFRPGSAEEIAHDVVEAARLGLCLDIRGGGSKAGFGAPVRHAAVLDVSALSSVIDYDPDELVLTVGAGARLADVEALVASRGQMLAFEPFDHGPIYGRGDGAATIGGVIAAGVSGSRRLSAGAVRDHLLGFKAVSGRGEIFTAGAKVVKNVTGYDLPKLLCGSWGRLAVMTEVTLKVLPRARFTASLIMEGLDAGSAQRVMAVAMRSQAEVSAAGYAPAVDGRASRTLLRLEGFEPSVRARARMLAAALDDHAALMAPTDEADAFWRDLRTLAPLGAEGALWRIGAPPSACGALVATLEPLGAKLLVDWAGGLVWARLDDHAEQVRAAAVRNGGYATLVRGSAEVRATVAPLHPLGRGVGALEARLRAAFDPFGVFETGRFPKAGAV